MAVRFVTVGDDLTLPADVVVPGGYTPTGDPDAWDIRYFLTGEEVWDTTGATSMHTILQRAINALNALWEADGIPRQVYIPNGIYKIAWDVKFKSGAGMKGQSEQGVRFMLTDGKTFSGGPVEDVNIETLTVDGANQWTGAYSTGDKGFFFQRMKDCSFTHVTCQNTVASGFGVDHLDGVRFDHCTAINCGRSVFLLENEALLGCSGFGLGAGDTTSGREPVSLIGCSAIGCGKFGIFIERQPVGAAIYAPGYKIIGCHVEGNLHGFGDVGAGGVIFTGNSVLANRSSGVYLANALSNAGINGLVAHNLIALNPVGVNIGRTYGPYTIESNEIRDNTSHGIDVGTNVLAAGMTIRGNRIRNNGGVGLRVIYGHEDLTIEQNAIRGNAGGDLTMTGAGTVSGLTIRLNDLRSSAVTITQNIATGLTEHDNLGWTYVP